MEPLKKSTLETTPAEPVAVRSDALAARVNCAPRLMVVPLAGDVRFTTGAGLGGFGVGDGDGFGVGVGVGVVVVETPLKTSA